MFSATMFSPGLGRGFAVVVFGLAIGALPAGGMFSR
jgi:hypothetical protein